MVFSIVSIKKAHPEGSGWTKECLMALGGASMPVQSEDILHYYKKCKYKFVFTKKQPSAIFCLISFF